MMSAPNWSFSRTTVEGPDGAAVTVTVVVGAGVGVGSGGGGVTVEARNSDGEVTARFSGDAAETECTEHHAARTTSRLPQRSVTVAQCKQWKPVTRMPRLLT